MILFRLEIHTKSIQPETRNGVMLAIVKILLKTLCEITRLRTFGKSGFQQLQVDVEYARVHLWRYLNDDKLVNTMLDGVIADATGRSFEPMGMEASVVEKILSLDSSVS